MIRPAWIAVDWGTSNLRAWAMGPGGVLAHAGSDKGMAALAQDQFEAALLDLIAPWLAADRVVDVVAAGMVGARQGWIEAPYVAVPSVPLVPGRMAVPKVSDTRFRICICHGLCQKKPADVMRGEETQIAGLLAQRPGFDGVACLPGTHTKWAEISAGEVCSFVSVMTGEIFALLSRQSVLRHTIGPQGLDRAEFLESLDASLTQPQSIAARLFSIRAEGLVAGIDPVVARSRLSGLLIGLELAATRPWWLGRAIVIVGSSALAETYRMALDHVGATAEVMDGETVTLAGLSAAYAAVSASGFPGQS